MKKILVLTTINNLAIEQLSDEVICEYATSKPTGRHLQNYAGIIIDLAVLQREAFSVPLPYVLVADNIGEGSGVAEFASASRCVGVVSGFAEKSYFLALKGLIACCYET